MNNEKALQRAHEEEATTIFGLEIEASSASSEDGIIRIALEEVSRLAWFELFKCDRNEEDIREGAEVVEQKFRESLQYNVEVVPPGEEPLGWYADTDPEYWFEYLEDEWLEEDVWEGVRWTWPEISLLACLLMIDLAVQALDENEPHKAGVWLFRSAEYLGRRRLASAPAMDATDLGALSRMGKRGANARHQSNRAVKERALQLYQERSWKSLAEAARSISPKVHRVEAVVLRWVREFRRNSSGKVGTPPRG